MENETVLAIEHKETNSSHSSSRLELLKVPLFSFFSPFLTPFCSRLLAIQKVFSESPPPVLSASPEKTRKAPSKNLSTAKLVYNKDFSVEEYRAIALGFRPDPMEEEETTQENAGNQQLVFNGDMGKLSMEESRALCTVTVTAGKE